MYVCMCLFLVRHLKVNNDTLLSVIYIKRARGFRFVCFFVHENVVKSFMKLCRCLGAVFFVHLPNKHIHTLAVVSVYRPHNPHAIRVTPSYIHQKRIFTK